MNAPTKHPIEGVRAIAEGEVITEPGQYEIPIDWYHGDCTDGPSISSSGIRDLFGKSPAHYWLTSCLNPDRVPPPEKEAFKFGRAAHHLLLGEANFGKHFVVRPVYAPGHEPGNPEGKEEKRWHGNMNVCKDWLATQAKAGLTVITPEDAVAIKGMSESLERNELVRAGILNGAIERSLIWKDEETGIWLKARPDAIPLDSADVADLKTAKAVDHPDLMKAIAERGYHVQGSLIGLGMKAVLGIEMASFSLVFVEKTPPFCSRVVTVKPSDIELGEAQIRASLRVFKRCLERGEWPGPGGVQRDAEFIDLPDWYRNRVKDRLTLIEEEFAA